MHQWRPLIVFRLLLLAAPLLAASKESESCPLESLEPAAIFAPISVGDFGMALVADGNVDGQSGLPGIEVQPTFHRSASFRFALLGVSIIALVVAAVFRLTLVPKMRRRRIGECQAERERIARELHDTLLPGIQSIVLRIQNWQTDSNIPDGYRREMSAVVRQARAIVIEGRDQILGLRYADSQPVDLVTALSDAKRGGPAAGRARFEIAVVGRQRPLPPQALRQVIAIGREAIRNAYRHANASRISATLDFRGRSMRMSISDDGIGIDPSAVACENRPDHFGLLGMRERAQELGASLYIGSNGLKGTRVTLSVPTGDAFSESKSLWRDSTRRPLREPFIQGEGAGASQ